MFFVKYKKRRMTVPFQGRIQFLALQIVSFDLDFKKIKYEKSLLPIFESCSCEIFATFDMVCFHTPCMATHIFCSGEL